MRRQGLTAVGGGMLIALAFAACDDGEVGDGACEPPIEAVSTIFAQSCAQASCHGAQDPAVGLDLSTPGLAERLVDQPAASCDRTLVVPGDAGRSFLYEKLTAPFPECGAPMPVIGALTEDHIGCIGAWIDSLPKGCETCGGAGCADLEGDPRHCGVCDLACPAGALCQGGRCSCGAGQQVCADTCVDPAYDASHCGQCDNACAGTLVCSLGECKSSCDSGLTQCGSSCVDTQNDPDHCGDCTTDCGTGLCKSGICDCGPGIDPQTDPENCGSCGHVCAPGQTCAQGSCICGDASVSLSSTIEPIFTASCATNGCHRAPAPKEGLDLSAGHAHAELVNVAADQCRGRMRVLPGDPGQSYLMDKLLGVNLCSGNQMPKAGTIDRADIEAIANWICGGALDN